MDCKDVYKIREKGMEKRKEANSIQEIIYKTKKEMKKYKELLYDFFGDFKEEKTIRQLYEKLHENIYHYSIRCVDLPKALEIYKEYNDGMFQFVKEIFCKEFNVGNDTYEEYRIKLDRAKNEDYNFINSLFGGKNNPMVEIPIRDSMQNIEILIGVIDYLGPIKEELCTLLEKVDCCEKTICKDTICLFCDSLSHFIFDMIKNACDYYKYIQDEVEHPNMKNDDQDKLELF